MCALKYSLADEERSISPRFSPGPVNNSEQLLRVLHQPEHILDGEVIESSVPLEDLKSRGFSVDRRAYVNLTLLSERVAEQVRRDPPNREASFSSELLCERLREILSEDKRDFLIVDEIDEKKEPVNSAHASIYSANETGKGGLRKIRHKLVGEINKKIIPHETLLRELSNTRNNTVGSWQRFIPTKNKPLLIVIILFLFLGFFIFLLGGDFLLSK